MKKLLHLYRRNRNEFWRIFRYLLVGGWNTFFGIAAYTLLYWLFGRKTGIVFLGKDPGYLLVMIPSNILAITNAYFCYKFLVFRTMGNYWREYLRCYLVYGSGMLFGAGLLFVLVEFFKVNPVAGNILRTGMIVLFSYFGHRYFSFRGRFRRLENKRIFVTGGTGFFGKSLLDYLRRHPIDGLEMVLLSRDPERLKKQAPELVELPFVKLVQGDVCDFEMDDFAFDYILHGATTSGAQVSDDEMRSVILDGTRNLLEFAGNCPELKRLLYISSGAVYGPQPVDVAHISESHPCHPETVYGECKLHAEELCRASGIFVSIARCFAFTGRYLPRNAHFAIGNFIADALAERPIVIQGDGTPLRSYLYADDLAEWLLTILMKGENQRVYNVGSRDAISIKTLAETVRSTLSSSSTIEVRKPHLGGAPQRYVPDVTRAEMELGLRVTIELDEAIRRSAE